VSFRKPTAAGIASKQGLLDILLGLYDRLEKPAGGNLTQFIQTVVNDTISGGGGGALANFCSAALVTVPSSQGTSEWVSPDFTFPLLALLIPNPTITLTAAFYAASVSGTSQYRLRVGGVLGATGLPAADGSIVGAAATAASSFGAQEISGTIPNPGGIVLVKLTLQASVAGAAKARGLHVVVN